VVVDRSELLGGDIPLRPLGLSELLDAAITGIRCNPKAVFGLSLTLAGGLEVLVALIGYLVIGNETRNGITPSAVLSALGGGSLLRVASLVLTAYTVLVMAGMVGPIYGRTLFGLSTSLREAWQDTRPVIWRLAGGTALTLCLSLGALIATAVPLILVAVLGGPPTAGILLGVLWVVAAVPLMIWLYVLHVLSAPAIVLERAGALGGLRRARTLIRGSWWRTFTALLLTTILTLFVYVILAIPFILLYALVYLLLGLAGIHMTGLLVMVLGTLAFTAPAVVTGSFDAGVIALLYIDLRMRREGLDLDLQTRPDLDRTNGDFLGLWAVR
jgi:hypothetical protein